MIRRTSRGFRLRASSLLAKRHSRARGRLPHVPIWPSGTDHHRGDDAQPRNQGHGPATGAVLRPEQGDDEVACCHCGAHPKPVSFALSRPPLHLGPRALRLVDATLSWHCRTARFAGHRLVPPLDLWSLCPAKNVHPNTISKIRRDITFDGRK